MTPRSISSFIAGFKSIITKRINILRDMPRVPVWQRNYYEHVIRNEIELNKLRKYIEENPLKWELDEDNPVNFNRGEHTGVRPYKGDK